MPNAGSGTHAAWPIYIYSLFFLDACAVIRVASYA